MLFERVPYLEKLPFAVSFTNVVQESKHCHEGIEIALALRGVVNYQIYHTNYELNEGDLIIADVADLHQIHRASEDALLLLIHVDTKRFEKLYPNISYMFFVCEECMVGAVGSNQVLQSKLAVLKNSMARLALAATEERKSVARLTEGVNELVSILVNHFQGFYMEDYQYKANTQNLSDVDLQRLSSITGYILSNYTNKITLEDVSRQEHLSPYYVSHLIKKTLGFSFQDFVNGIRLEFAEKQLVSTTDTLMQISENCGFSSPNYFNKCFSAWHGKTPAQYRKEYKPCDRSFGKNFSLAEAGSLLQPYLNLSPEVEGKQQLVIEADYKKAYEVSLQETFSPRIQISSISEFLQAVALEKRIKELYPSAFLLSEELQRVLPQKGEASVFDVPILWIRGQDKETTMETDFAPHAASAFCHISGTADWGSRGIPLIGRGKAIFTENCLPTPYFFAYHLFAKYPGASVEAGTQHMIINKDGNLAIVLFNMNPHSVLNVRIPTGKLPERFYMSQTDIFQEDNCYSVLAELGAADTPEPPTSIPRFLIERMESRCCGKPRFSVVERLQTPEINLILYQNAVTILEIVPQA